MDFSELKSVHLVGIKGVGMTALAEILRSHNIAVTGSDVADVFITDAVLLRLGIPVTEGFSEENIHKPDLVIHSAVWTKENNPEIIAALEKKIPLMSYPQALGILMQQKFGIAIVGSHGKTTTTALLAYILKEARMDPIAVVGSVANNWKSNALSGRGKYFVVEADEYQNKLQYLNPLAVILTNVDWDHPDYFPTKESYKKVFVDFVSRIPRHGFLVACGDDAIVQNIITHARCSVLTYGTKEINDCVVRYDAARLTPDGFLQRFTLRFDSSSVRDIEMRLPGEHNALNATAAFLLAKKLGVSEEKIRTGIETFSGTARRFEYKGIFHGAKLFDDYAHHPQELRATLHAARQYFPTERLWAVFHPHTFSRTEALFDDFVGSFDNADTVIILDIYASAREKKGAVSSRDLVEKINSYGVKKAVHCPTIEDATKYLLENVESNSIVMTLGAGDV